MVLKNIRYQLVGRQWFQLSNLLYCSRFGFLAPEVNLREADYKTANRRKKMNKSRDLNIKRSQWHFCRKWPNLLIQWLSFLFHPVPSLYFQTPAPALCGRVFLSHVPLYREDEQHNIASILEDIHCPAQGHFSRVNALLWWGGLKLAGPDVQSTLSILFYCKDK